MKKSFKLDRDLIIIDVETSGTSYQTSSIIQLGAVRFTAEGKIIEPGFNAFIRPYTGEWSEEAYRVHKIEKAFLEANGTHLATVLKAFEEFVTNNTLSDKYFDKCYLAQWSCGFDTNMLISAYKKIGRNYPFGYRSIDIASIVRFHLACNNQSSKYGCHKSAERLGIDVSQFKAHNAYDDARITAHALKKVIENVVDQSKSFK